MLVDTRSRAVPTRPQGERPRTYRRRLHAARRATRRRTRARRPGCRDWAEEPGTRARETARVPGLAAARVLDARQVAQPLGRLCARWRSAVQAVPQRAGCREPVSGGGSSKESGTDSAEISMLATSTDWPSSPGAEQREIARFRGVTRQTIANQLHASFDKLQVSSRAELVHSRHDGASPPRATVVRECSGAQALRSGGFSDCVVVSTRTAHPLDRQSLRPAASAPAWLRRARRGIWRSRRRWAALGPFAARRACRRQ